MQKINLVIPDNMDYRTSEAYRTLRTNVLFCGEEINAIADVYKRQSLAHRGTISG